MLFHSPGVCNSLLVLLYEWTFLNLHTCMQKIFDTEVIWNQKRVEKVVKNVVKNVGKGLCPETHYLKNTVLQCGLAQLQCLGYRNPSFAVQYEVKLLCKRSCGELLTFKNICEVISPALTIGCN